MLPPWSIYPSYPEKFYEGKASRLCDHCLSEAEYFEDDPATRYMCPLHFAVIHPEFNDPSTNS